MSLLRAVQKVAERAKCSLHAKIFYACANSRPPVRSCAVPRQLPERGPTVIRRPSVRDSGLPTRTKQSFVMGLDRCVAFAGGLAEAVQIGDLDVSPAIADEMGLLQRVGHQRYAVAAGSDHLRHRFLRQNKLVAAGEVARMQQA